MPPRVGIALALVLFFALSGAADLWGESDPYHAPSSVRPTEAEQRVAERIRHEFGLLSRPLPRLHPGILQAARLKANDLLRDESPDWDSFGQADLRESLRRFGVSDYPVRGGMAVGSDLESVTTRLLEWSRGLGDGAWNRFGVGLAQTDGRVAAVVLLTRCLLDLAPVPKHLEAPASLTLEGRTEGGGVLSLHVTAPDGQVVTHHPTRIASGAFSQVVVLKTEGLHRIEILADGGRGPQVASLLQVCVTHCEAADRLPDLAAPANPDPAQARHYAVAWINAFRVLHGLPALQPDERLRAVMEGHLVRLPLDGPLSHVDEAGQGPAHRLAEAGLRVWAFGENLGRHSRLDLLLAKLTESPAHRQNLLSPQVTHVGVGVVRHEGRGVWILGQLFAAFEEAGPSRKERERQPPSPLDPVVQ